MQLLPPLLESLEAEVPPGPSWRYDSTGTATDDAAARSAGVTSTWHPCTAGGTAYNRTTDVVLDGTESTDVRDDAYLHC